ncbi:MAG: DUF2061 domain-containing protein [Pseudomonadota bacterium]
METRSRTLAKAVTWQLSGLVAMTAIGYAVTGSVAAGGTVAVAGTAVGFVSYIVHERIWAAIGWGRRG